MNFILDDGNKSRGHRENLFNEDLSVLGISCGKHLKHGHCCVINFAGQMEEHESLQKKTENLEVIVSILEEFVGSQAINDLVLEETDRSFENEKLNSFSEVVNRKKIETNLNGQNEFDQFENNEKLQKGFDSFKKRKSNESLSIKNKKKIKSKFANKNDLKHTVNIEKNIKNDDLLNQLLTPSIKTKNQSYKQINEKEINNYSKPFKKKKIKSLKFNQGIS